MVRLLAATLDGRAKFNAMRIVDMKDTVEYQEDTYGLKTLDAKGGPFRYAVDGIAHNCWLLDGWSGCSLEDVYSQHGAASRERQVVPTANISHPNEMFTGDLLRRTLQFGQPLRHHATVQSQTRFERRTIRSPRSARKWALAKSSTSRSTSIALA
ncbi:Lysosomal thioesterase ppt2 [Globisporangium polare]